MQNIFICFRQENEATLEIPESFLDSITWELMTQPITLPSGKVIDQTTLEKHEQHQAIWGRSASDPFTSIPFSKYRKPVMATALKIRIDKFLLENSNSDEIKKMPRVLGHGATSAIARNRQIIEVPKYALNKNLLKRTAEDAKLNTRQMMKNDSGKTNGYCHKLPAIVTYPKQSTANARLKRVGKMNLNSSTSVCNTYHNHNRDDELEIIEIDSSVDDGAKALLSNKRFRVPEKVELCDRSGNCKCCNNNILYRLPCKHVICRKVLLSIENSQCKSCGLSYKSSDVERIHGIISSR